jgi:hypothetical protein
MTQHSPSPGASGGLHANELARLEEFIRDLPEGSDTPGGLLRERLEGARFYLVGSMPHEYGLNLEMAKEILPDLDDAALRSRIEEFIQNQHH